MRRFEGQGLGFRKHGNSCGLLLMGRLCVQGAFEASCRCVSFLCVGRKVKEQCPFLIVMAHT